MRSPTAVGLVAFISACGGAPKPEAQPALPPRVQSTDSAPSVTPPAESMPRVISPSAPAPAGRASRPAAEHRLRDSVTLPIGMVDSNGKFVPLKKRP